ncbi:hypothetical protein G7Z17_g13109 [Cylindrodendrum hubeiense]|uniref:Nuclear speckle splicing regulatory protein 1 N-terminal domain-containing protein n=1 Tax=Cylindrodendrum hubeiense TaxID=595255 RepID=A0A9P5GXP3_9HYPO|nr:hypothetical protein G7Z17_g13109 [Cylindrodendrum hubeiense]
MSKPLAFGLNKTKKPGASKPAPPKRKPMFGGDDDSDDDGANREGKAEAIGEFDDFDALPVSKSTSARTTSKSKNGPPTQPPKLKAKGQPNAMFGDLSGSLTSRRNAEAASQVDASVYEYDTVYESFKPKKQTTKEDEQKRPKYMHNLMQAAEVRKRDALIAEEKKIAREREAEGDEYEGKEKFVTDAYRKQQEENKRIEEEEKKREEEEAKKNKGGGMSAFYRKLLDKDEQRHADIIKATQENAKNGPPEDDKEEQPDKEKTEADVAKEMNQKGASVALNEDGQVVDKRQLLRGGLNIGAKKKESVQREAERPAQGVRKEVSGQQIGRKQAMRERQSRMLAEQLEQSMKRSREDEEAQREEVERASKSRKTEGDISSAKERYLARKRAAEEEKAKAAAGGN